MGPLVSIVLPTYKRADRLKGTIDSVMNQTYANWELVVVDDNGLSDPVSRKTREIIENYRGLNRVAFVGHEVNKGACAARNTGIAHARGEFVAFLDDDDTWAPNKLELQLAAFQADPGLGFVFCDLLCVDSTDNTRKLVKYGFGRETLFRDLLRNGAGICTSALVIRRDLLESIGGFDASLPSYQDYDLLLRLALRSRGVAVEEPLLCYNVSQDGISRNYESKFIGKKLILEKYLEHFSARDLSRYFAFHLGVLADYAVLHGRRWTAVKYYTLSISKWPASIPPYAKLLATLVGGQWLYKRASSMYHQLARSPSRR